MADLIRETYSSASVCPVQLLQVAVKGDVIVPDRKPDAGKILQTSVRYLPEDTALERKRIRLMGQLEFTVLYLSQEEMPRLCSLTAALPVEEEINLEGLAEENERVRYQIGCHPENVRSTLLNGRKMSLSALLEIEAKITKYQDTSVVTDVVGEDSLVLRQKKETMRRIIGDKEEKLIVREVAEVRDGSPNIEEILWYDASIRHRSSHILEDRVQVKGEIVVSVLYQTENGVQFLDHSTEFAGLIDAAGAREGMNVGLQMEITKTMLQVMPDSDSELRRIQMEMVVGCRVRITEEEEKQLLVDAYDTKQNVSLTQSQRPVQRQICQKQLKTDVTEILEIPESLPMALQVFYTTAEPKIDDIFLQEGQLQIEGVLYVTVFCLTADDRSPVISFTQPVPFSKTESISGLRPGQNAEVSAYVEGVRSELQNERRLNMAAELVLEAEVLEENMKAVVTDLAVSEAEAEELPSMALCFLQPGEDVWDVGKRYRVRPEALERMGDQTVLIVK